MNLGIRQIVIAVAVVIATVSVAIICAEHASYGLFVGLVGLFGVLVASSYKPSSELNELLALVDRIKRGGQPHLPTNSSAIVEKTIQSLSELAENSARAQRSAVETLKGAIEAASNGKKTDAPVGTPTEMRKVFVCLAQLANVVGDMDARTRTNMETARVTSASICETAMAQREVALERQRTSEAMVANAKASWVYFNEMQETAKSIRVATNTVTPSTKQMMVNNESIASGIGELAVCVRETASATEEMTFSVRDVAKQTDAIAATAESTGISIAEMDSSIEEVQTHAQDTAHLSENISTDAVSGGAAIAKTLAEIGRIRESTRESVEVISTLGIRINAIGQILNVIEDVAEQTNLLSLNASIIAAQAGIHGEGFGVVASEIKGLAGRARTSTKEIAEIINTIQTESSNAIAVVERGAQNVERCADVSIDAERMLRKILESSQKSIDMVKSIARATHEQTKSSRQVTNAFAQVAGSVQQISVATAQQARGSEIIMRSVEQMRELIHQMELAISEQVREGREAAVMIDGASDELDHMLSVFRSFYEMGQNSDKSLVSLGDALSDDQNTLRDIADEARSIAAMCAPPTPNTADATPY